MCGPLPLNPTRDAKICPAGLTAEGGEIVSLTQRDERKLERRWLRFVAFWKHCAVNQAS